MIGTVKKNDAETVSLELALKAVGLREVQAMLREHEWETHKCRGGHLSQDWREISEQVEEAWLFSMMERKELT